MSSFAKSKETSLVSSDSPTIEFRVTNGSQSGTISPSSNLSIYSDEEVSFTSPEKTKIDTDPQEGKFVIEKKDNRSFILKPIFTLSSISTPIIIKYTQEGANPTPTDIQITLKIQPRIIKKITYSINPYPRIRAGESLTLTVDGISETGSKVNISNYNLDAQVTSSSPRVTITKVNENTFNVKDSGGVIPDGTKIIEQELKFSIPENLSQKKVEETVKISIEKRNGYITFIPEIAEPLTRTKTIDTTAVLNVFTGPEDTKKYLNFEVISGFLPQNQNDDLWVSQRMIGSKLFVSWKEPTSSELASRGISPATAVRPSQVTITITGYIPNSQDTVTSNVVVQLREVVGFTNLKVKLNVMDERTVKDLYGATTNNDYYVLTVRLYNNLKGENNSPTNTSILAYSSSIEVAVMLEKRLLKSKKSAFDSKKSNNSAIVPGAEVTKQIGETQGQIQELLKKQLEIGSKASISLAELTSLWRSYLEAPGNDSYQKFENKQLEYKVLRDSYENFSLKISELKLVLEDLNKTLNYSSNGTVYEDDLWHLVTIDDFNKFQLSTTNRVNDLAVPLTPLSQDQKRQIEEEAKKRKTFNLTSENENGAPCSGLLTYRPMTFEMVVNTVDRRSDRGQRGLTFKLLELFGSVGSVATSIAFPGEGNTTTLALDKFRNLFLPNLDKIFPNLKEQYRQNIVSQVMKPLEEIPFGSDITRVIFLPKKPIDGLLRGHQVRISEICPFFFRIEVGLVNNPATVQVNDTRKSN